jgi:hypothetical protein
MVSDVAQLVEDALLVPRPTGRDHYAEGVAAGLFKQDPSRVTIGALRTYPADMLHWHLSALDPPTTVARSASGRHWHRNKLKLAKERVRKLDRLRATFDAALPDVHALAAMVTGEQIGATDQIDGARDLVERAAAAAALEVSLRTEDLALAERAESAHGRTDHQRRALGLLVANLRRWTPDDWPLPRVAQLVAWSVYDWTSHPCPRLVPHSTRSNFKGADPVGTLGDRFKDLWRRKGRGGFSAADVYMTLVKGQIGDLSPAGNRQSAP